MDGVGFDFILPNSNQLIPGFLVDRLEADKKESPRACLGLD